MQRGTGARIGVLVAGALVAAGCGAGTAAHVVAPPRSTTSAASTGATTTAAAGAPGPTSATTASGGATIDSQSVSAINSELQNLSQMLAQTNQDLATGKEES